MPECKKGISNGGRTTRGEDPVWGTAIHLDFRQILSSLADPVVAADATNRIVYANLGVAELLGWKPEELIGQPLTVLMPERLRPLHLEGFERYLQTRRGRIIGQPVQVPAARRTGEEIPIELAISVAVEGDSPLFVATMRDLRERVELERQLKVTRYLRATTEAAARLTTRLDVPELLNTVMATLVDDFGAALTRVWLYQPTFNTLHLAATSGPTRVTFDKATQEIDVAEDPSKVGHVARTWTPFIKNTLLGDAQFDQEWVARENIEAVAVFPLLHGVHLHGVLEFFSRRESPDELIQVLSTFVTLIATSLADVDLFQREQRARSDAEAERARLSFLAEAAGLLSTSLQYETTLANVARLAVARLADWCAVDILAEDGTVQRLEVASADPEKIGSVREYEERYQPPPPEQAHLLRVLRTAQSTMGDISLDQLLAQACDAREEELLRILDMRSFMCVPITLYGRALGALTFVSSGPHRRYGPSDLRLAETLAQRAALAIENSRLYAEVQNTMRARDDFLSLISHDLKNPLTALHGYAQLLRRRLDRLQPEEAASWERGLASIETTADKMFHLLNDLVEVARSRAEPQLDLHRDAVDLVALASVTAAEFQQTTDMHSIAVVCTTSSLVGVWDALRLERVLGNLLSNAIKYSPEGGRVTIRVGEQVDSSGRVAVLRVEDGGIGVPRDEMEHIFERFHRASNVVGRIGGTGIGLAGARQIVEQHGGRITVTSTEGAGSTFQVQLPLE